MNITPQHTEMLKARYVYEKTIDEIAVTMELTEHDVLSALAKLRLTIDKMKLLTNSDLFNPETATEEEMRERCRRLGKSQEYADFCVDAFVLKLRRKVLAEKHESCTYLHSPSTAQDTVKRVKARRKRELLSN